MPELPEVETVRRGLAAVLEGRVLAEVRIFRPDLRKPFPEGFAARLTGRRVVAVGRRAKYLVVTLAGDAAGDPGLVLLAHLGMSGRMVITRGRNAPPGKHDHVVFRTDDGTEVWFTDPRRFGLMTLCRPADLAAHPLVAGLGPEPLAEAFTPSVLAAALAGKAAAIKTALLDQRMVAGIGNIYACEALFRAGIAPQRAAGTLAAAAFDRLVPAIVAVLTEAIAVGGSSLRDHVQPSGELGYFQHRFAVYGREGQPCAAPGCGGVVERVVQGGRSTFYCANCQS